MSHNHKLPVPARVLLGILAVLLIVVLAYVIYVFTDYHRIPDRQPAEISRSSEAQGTVQPGIPYTAVSWNIGFGAYTPDFSFFMDGGEKARANSKDSVVNCTVSSGDYIQALQPDFVLFEEVDFNSDRSWHVDQQQILDNALAGMSCSKAINYDSPYLFYPFQEPIGKSLSGLLTYSRFPIASALRRSLPISSSVTKIVDLDRCYTVSRVPVENGRELVIYTVHLTAYTSDKSVREGQMDMLFNDMRGEYAAGNYVLCGGDFNTDLLAESLLPGAPDWALPFDRAILGDEFTLCWDTLSADEKAVMTHSCRDTGMPLTPATPTWLLDGFILSNNITINETECLDAGFRWSDHNPVKVVFTLKD